MGDPSLSLVVFGRNDNYGGDYTYRLNTSINHLGLVAERTGVLDDIEFVYVDWGSEEPMAEALRLNEPAARMVRFLQVSPEQAARLCPSPVLHTTLITNMGARRARGEYIVVADSDTLYVDTALQNMVRVAKGELDLPVDARATLFPIRRYQMPYDRVRRQPSVAEWDRVLPLLGAGVRIEAPGQSGIGGFAAALMMHRSMWNRLGGYNEKFDRAWGWVDNELMMRAMQNHTWFDLAHVGVFAMHMEHAPKRLEDVNANAPKLEKINRMVVSAVERPSGPDWGAPDETLSETRGGSVVSIKGAAAPLGKPLSGAFAKRAAFDELLGNKFFQNARDHLCARWAFGAEISPDDSDAALVLHGFCVSEHPASMLYIGQLSAPSVAAVFAECRAIEAAFVGPWTAGDANDLAFNPANFTIVASVTGYQGYSRMVTGAKSMYGALASRLTSDMKPVELIVLDRRSADDEDDALLGLALDLLAPGGMLLTIDGETSETEQRGEVTAFDRISGLFPASSSRGRASRAAVVTATQSVRAHELAGGGVTAIFAAMDHAGRGRVREAAHA